MTSLGRWTKIFAASLLATAVIGMNAGAASTVRATTNVNVRKGPGSSYSVVAVLDKGDKATRIGSSNDWIKIKTNSHKGYVYKDYLTRTSSSTKTRYCTASALNVRSRASTSASVIGSLSYGDSCKAVRITNGWAKIKYGGSYGYVSNDYLSPNKPSGGSSSNSSTKIRYCTASALNVRSRASTSASVIASLSYGEQCTVISFSNGWAKIRYDGKIGYVSSEYLSRHKPSGGSSSGKKITSVAKSLLNCQYKYGAAGPKKFDCSGFTQYVYKKCGKSIPRTSASQFKSRTHVSRSNIRAGDLLFFDTNDSGSVSHVGIYLGNNRMIHSANSKDDVCIDTITSGYYRQRYKGAGRY